MFKPKFSQPEQGFTLVEVLVSILIVTLFTGVAMQAMVIAAVFKAKAQHLAEATTWIQEDLENVKYLATQYVDTTECAATAVNDGYADGFRDSFTTGATNGSHDFTVLPDPKISRTGKPFRITRTTNPVNTSPFIVLQVTYAVSAVNNGAIVGLPVAKFYTEIIPNAAFECP